MLPSIDTIVVVLTCLLTFYFTLKNRSKPVIVLLSFSLSMNFFIELGTRWTLWKVFALSYWAAYFIRRASKRERLIPEYLPREFVFLVILIFINSLLQYMRLEIYKPEYYYQVPLFQSLKMRTFIQLVSYLLKCSYFIIPLTIIIEKKMNIKTFLNDYLVMTTILNLYGIYQIIAFKFGLPFRGIQYSAWHTGLGMFSVMDKTIFRVNSLANEPKQLALFLLPSLGMLIYTNVIRKRGWDNIWKLWNLAFHLFVFIMAFSTAGFGGIAMGLLFEFLYLSNILKVNRYYLILLLSITASLSFLALVFTLEGKDIVFEALKFRIFQNPIPFPQRMEGKALLYLFRHPHNILFGFGPGNYNFYIPGTVGKWGVAPIVSDAIAMLLDNGIIGLILSISLFFKVFRRALVYVQQPEKNYHWLKLGISGSIMALAGYGVLGGLYLYMFFLGVIWAEYCRLKGLIQPNA